MSGGVGTWKPEGQSATQSDTAGEEDAHVELDIAHRHGLLELCIMSGCAVDCFWDEFEDEIEVDFILLGLNPYIKREKRVSALSVSLPLVLD